MNRRNLLGILVLFALPIWQGFAAETPLVPAGSVWKYLDNGSNQGTGWRAPAFVDSAWKSGAAQLGYGDGGEATVVGFGPNASNKYVTTYFRRAFPVASPAQFTSVTLRILRDDGAVVYLNGAAVFRTNMPSGTIGYRTLASTAVGGADESAWYSITLNPAALVSGNNVLAVEVHQSGVTSSDVSFDLQLIGSDAPALVTRGPYLQLGTPGSTVVRWRTDVATDSRVRYGPTPGAPVWFTDDAASATEHQISLTGLSPNTQYCYSVGTTAQTLAGGDANHCFHTSPQAGTVQPIRVWVLGDAGTASAGQKAVRDAYLAYTGTTRTDLWLMLGDNAYENGLDTEYQTKVFDIYPSLFRSSVLWPSIGNHDTAQSTNPPASLAYFQMFTLPTGGEAGGLASGTEKYYSFDYGNIHFIALDSQSSDKTATGPMVTWLKQDLAATSQRWKIAYWHHPPYSKGTHDSDTATESKAMRENVVPALEAGGVDLVMVGHSHVYERSFLIDGHYGTSGTFSASMKKDGGDGRVDGNGPYTKPGTGTREGAVYMVAGVSGKIGNFLGVHPAMYLSQSQLGSLVLDVNGDQLDVKFLRDTGAIADYFTIRKGVGLTPPNAPSNLAASAVSASQIDLSWTDHAPNEAGYRIERSTDGVNFAVVATVAGNVVSYSHTGLTASTTYTYRVLAFNSAGDSGYSNLAAATTAAGAVTLLASQAVWKYLDNGSNQGTAWRATGFADGAWLSGAAQLGYGDGDEGTIVGFGPNASAKYITTYFRRAFTVSNPAQFASLTLKVLRDDGAVVYLNGTEVFRTNMPSGTVGHTTLAPVAIGGAEESTWYSTTLSPALLTAGTNVLAVEVHQANGTSSDVSFDLQLIGSPAP